VIQHDFGTVSPNIIEQVEHDADRFVPYQPSISLEVVLRKGQHRQQLHTSEKAGVVTVWCLFHSSPSEATMFRPKADSTLYSLTGLGNLARELATSYKQRKEKIHPVRGRLSLTLIVAASAR
jgi:hypothetical protein